VTPRRYPVLAVAVALSLALSLAGALATAALASPTPRASLTDVEDQVMCVVCHTPLAVSESPQADSERQYIRMLIAQGLTKNQIKQQLVAQYGQSVLALPSPHGFNLTVYILPPAILLAGIGLLVVTLPKWRRRARAATLRPAATGPVLDPAEARRLEDDIARFE
jgi:cytochrome c-type biogenesis protein CcmH